MRLLLLLLFIFTLIADITEACCWGWCCPGDDRRVSPVAYTPSHEEAAEDSRIAARLTGIKHISIIDVDKEACNALGIRHEDLLALRVEEERRRTGTLTTGTIVATTRRSSITKLAGLDTSYDFFHSLALRGELSEGDVENCLKHLEITRDQLTDLRKKGTDARESEAGREID